ncbi:hypothetical protein VTO73DRAFT_7005 [Trametes versicolor]
MDLSTGNVDARARSECLLLPSIFGWVGDGELPRKDEVRGEAAVLVWRVVGVPGSQIPKSVRSKQWVRHEAFETQARGAREVVVRQLRFGKRQKKQSSG